MVIMSDGGHVCLDWYNVKSKDQPTVLFLPGITGTDIQTYDIPQV
jgi:predicted alpha/beta-fold hydrolase